MSQYYNAPDLFYYNYSILGSTVFGEAYKAYKSTLSLAVHNELDRYICDNNLYIDELELFKVFKT